MRRTLVVVSATDGHEHDGRWGEPVDTLDGRLAAIALLIDGLDNETNDNRRRRRAAIAMRLLGRLGHDVNERILEQLDRIEFE